MNAPTLTVTLKAHAAGFESAMALWAISDLERAANEATSAANRLHRAKEAGAIELADRSRLNKLLKSIAGSLAEIERTAE